MGSSGLSFDSLRGLSKHLKGETDTQEELTEMYGRMKFKSRQDRHFTINNVHSMNSNGRTRTAFNDGGGRLNNSTDLNFEEEEEDEFDRPRSNLAGMVRKRAAAEAAASVMGSDGSRPSSLKTPSYPSSFEKEGVKGIERWMDDLNSEIVGEKAQIKSIQGEVQRLHSAFIEKSEQRQGKDEELNLNTVLEGFEKLQSLHKMLTNLQNESNLNLNEPIADELSSEF